MIGRERELELLGARTASPGSTVQIVGPPGMGKSTLARALVPGEAVWVELEEASDPLVALAEALDSPASASVVADALAEVEWLVLDGAEGHAEALPPLIESWDGPRVVVTSRQRLPVGSVLELGPLTQEQARDLFLTRADQLVSGIDLSADGAAIEALVLALGSWPLALELAAARLRLFSPQELLDEARRGSASDGLADTLARSWNRLEPPSRQALAAAARFCAPFDRQAFLAVGGTVAELETLLDASLVRWTPTTRLFQVLAPIRSFVRGQGLTNGEPAYASFVLDKAEQILEHTLEDGRPWMADLEAVARLGGDLGARAHACLAEFALLNGPLEPRLRALQAFDRRHLDAPRERQLRLLECDLLLRMRDGDGALALLDPEATDAETLHRIGSAHYRALRTDQAETTFELALATAEAQGDALQAAHTAYLHGSLKMRLGQTEAAERLLLRALKGVRPLGQPGFEASIEKFLAMHARECGSPATARVARLRRAVQLLESSHRRRVATATRARLTLALADAKDPAALELTEAAEAAARRIGLRGVVQEVLLTRAMILIERRDLAGAEVQLQAARVRGLPWVHATSAMLEAVVRWEQGDRAGASQQIAQSVVALKEARIDLDVAMAQCFQAVIDGCLPDPPIVPMTPLQTAALELVQAKLGGPEATPEAMALCDTTIDARLLVRMATAGVGVEVGADGTWFAVDGKRVDLRRKRVLRRVLQVLAESAGKDVEAMAVLRQSWPDERPTEASGRARVHVAIGELRKLGLREVLHTTDGGYRLDAELRRE